MAQFVKRCARLSLCALGAALGATALPLPPWASAQTPAIGIADPTTPAPGYGPPGAAGEPKRSDETGANSAEANRLQMILVQGDKRSAIVGGHSVHVGDTVAIEGAAGRVEQIDEGALVVRQGGSRKVLHLIEDSAAVRRKPQCSNKLAGGSACGTQ